MSEVKRFPEGMIPLGAEPFSFRCHPGVACFTVCCRNVDLDLYPYDIVRLKNCLGLSSEVFIRNHTELKQGPNPFFPTVKLGLVPSDSGQKCPFLTVDGCSVYRDRPTACRTYPLERAVDRQRRRGVAEDFYFMTDHSYCLGHHEEHQYTVKQWLRSQRLDEYNVINDLWAEIDTLFACNPFKGEGVGGPKQQMAFMACYNIDGFRTFAEQQRLLEQFPVDRDRKRRIARNDEELLKFAFEWLKHYLGGALS